MTATPRTLLVAIELSHGPDAAIEGALALARAEHANIVFATVIDHVPTGLTGLEGMAMEVDPLEIGHLAHDATRSALEEHIAGHDTDGVTWELHVRMGHVIDELIGVADTVSADVLVVGRSNAGAIERALLGSTAERLMRHAGRPVAIVPDGTWRKPKKVLFATDFGVCLDAQRDLLRTLELAEGAEIIVLAVSAPPTYLGDIVGDAVVRGDLVRELTRQYQDGAQRVAASLDELGFRATALATQGEPAAEILETARARGADAIIIGTRGRKGAARFLVGNTAERVARRFSGLTFVVPAAQD